MNFGIIALQMDMITSAVQPGTQAGAEMRGFQHAQLVRAVAKAGFDTIELGGDLAVFLPHTYAPPAIQSLQELKEELEINYTIHLPLWSVEPSTPLEAVRLGSTRAITEIILATQPLNPSVYVLHATGALAAEFYQMKLPSGLKELLLRQFQQGAATSIREILTATNINPSQLAIETIEFPLDLTLELAEWLDLGICLDTGHVLAGFSGDWELMQALERCLPRLQEIHLHDAPWHGNNKAIGYGLDHQPLGQGDLETDRLFERLEMADFTGPVIFELSVAEAYASLAVIQRTRPQIIPAHLQNRS